MLEDDQLLVNKTNEKYGFEILIGHPVLVTVGICLLFAFSISVTLAADRYYILYHSFIGTLLFAAGLILGMVITAVGNRKASEHSEEVEFLEEYELEPILNSADEMKRIMNFLLAMDIMAVIFCFSLLFLHNGKATTEMIIFPIMLISGICSGIIGTKYNPVATKRFIKIVQVKADQHGRSC